MTLVTLSPTTVTVTAYNAYAPSDHVGGDTALGDGSDATFGEVWTSRRPGDVGQDRIFATFAPIADLRTLNSITLSARVRYHLSGTAATMRFDMQAETATDYLGTFLTPIVDEYASTVAVVETTYTLTDWTYSGSLSVTGAALAAGTFQMDISPLSKDTDPGTTADWGLTVYELALIVDYTGALAPAPLRIYPRSSTRLYPRRNTRRPGTF